MKQEIWAAPLLLLPGVALLIASTSARYSRLHDEIHHFRKDHPSDHTALLGLFSRARLFHRALVSLYVSVAFLAMSSLVGGLLTLLSQPAVTATFVLTCSGILALVLASFFLIRESLKALDVIRDHVGHGSEIGHDETGQSRDRDRHHHRQ